MVCFWGDGCGLVGGDHMQGLGGMNLVFGACLATGVEPATSRRHHHRRVARVQPYRLHATVIM